MKKNLFWITFLIGLSSISWLCLGTKSYALTGTDFNPASIIDDGVFFNPGDFNVGSVQTFLNNKVPLCDTNGTQPYAGTTRAIYGTSKGYPPPYICLKDYTQDTQTQPSENGLCNQYTGGTKTAAQIIYDVSIACGINPKAIIVLLEKEQALIGDDWPWSIQYRSATGYGCPDTTACDSTYYGFFNQVYMAARQFKKYARDESMYRYRNYRDNYIQYNPNATCGGTSIFILNQATAGLYNYTPYQPNNAALSSLYGIGDSCSAYGNRNFWRLFNDWFGTTKANVPADNYPHPDGTLIKYQTDPRVYIIQNGKKRHLTSLEIFTSYRFTFDMVKPFSSGDLMLPFGDPVNNIKPGTVVKTPSSQNYYLVYEPQTGVSKSTTITPSVFTSLGLLQKNVVYISDSQLPPIGSDEILETGPHPFGSLVIDKQTLSVYMVWDASKRHIPSPNVLKSLGYSFADVVIANQADLSLPNIEDITYKEGTVLIDSYGKISVFNINDSDNSQELIHIPNPTVYIGLRYKWTEPLLLDYSLNALIRPMTPAFY